MDFRFFKFLIAFLTKKKLVEILQKKNEKYKIILQEARREEMLVNRLMRQSQQERRIAVQLLQARREKDVIRKNRLIREKQDEERRLKEFEDALNKEAVSVTFVSTAILKGYLIQKMFR